MKFLLSNKPLIPRLSFPKNRDLVLAMRQAVPVDAVVRDIRLPAHEPLRKRRLPVENLRPFLKPVNFLGSDVGPERFRVLFSTAVKVEVTIHALHVGITDKFAARREN